MTYADVDSLLRAARAGITRVGPRDAADAVAAGALIVDIRPEWQRRAYGEIPGSVVVERNHLEWRLHPGSDARLPLAEPGQEWVVTCQEGYASSLATASLVSLGLTAYDLDGGVEAWREAGLPVVAGPTAVEQVVAGPSDPVVTSPA